MIAPPRAKTTSAVRNGILKAFGDAFPDGRIEQERMASIMKVLLPSAIHAELDTLLNSNVSVDGDINLDDFIDNIFADSGKNGSIEVSSPLPSTCPLCKSAWAKSRRNEAFQMAEAARELLPNRVILVRHGESEGNVDHEIYRSTPDNAIELTDRGSEQAEAAGKRIKEIVGDDCIQLIVSPFQRTLQTARNILESIRPQVVQDIKDPRIREQEFGNLQRDDFIKFRQEQKVVGRYFYRFPTGESGADVHARVKDWWESSLLKVNLRSGHQHVDSVVVVTHGVTMRFILMQLFDWSPNTFQTIYNAENCAIYVLQKDLSLPGHSPYSLSPNLGDWPRSSIELNITFKSGETKLYTLWDYLSLPMPRTRQPEFTKQMLADQHGLRADNIVKIDYYGGRFKKWR